MYRKCRHYICRFPTTWTGQHRIHFIELFARDERERDRKKVRLFDSRVVYNPLNKHAFRYIVDRRVFFICLPAKRILSCASRDASLHVKRVLACRCSFRQAQCLYRSSSAEDIRAAGCSEHPSVRNILQLTNDRKTTSQKLQPRTKTVRYPYCSLN